MYKLILPAVLGLFAATLPLHAAGMSDTTASGNVATDFSAQASAYATVTYNYSQPVPEPASWALMVGGLALLARRAVQKQG